MLLTDTDTVETHDRHDHEAETYDAMAEWILATWEDDDYLIAPGPIPFANREHVDYLTDAIDQIRPLAGRRILEVGAGGGTLAVWLAHEGAEVVGIDVSSGILDVARRRAERRRRRLHVRAHPDRSFCRGSVRLGRGWLRRHHR